jgi:hypothetical protein
LAALRPAQAKPAEQVPLLPVPQHGWPAPPQAPHWLPVAEIRHDIVVPQAVCPAPASPAAMTGQQGWPVPPQVEHIPGIPLALVRPVHANPVLQVPALAVPQQGCPEAPQMAHTLSPSPDVQPPV